MKPPDAPGQALDRRIRVAIVTQSLDDGGLERLVQTLALNLDPNDFAPGVFVLREFGVYKDELDRAGVPVRDCRESQFRIRGLPLRLILRLRDFRPDIIHSHSGTWLPSTISKSVLRYPRLAFTDHGRYPPEPWLRALIEKWCAARTDLVTAVSTPVADYLTEYLDLQETPTVVPNGIDLERFSASRPEARERLRSEWGAEDEDILFACVGRLVEAKNHADLLRALARICHPTARIQLALFGQGPLEADIRKLVRQLDLEDRVHLLGFREDMTDCLRACDGFVLSSTTEGMPLSVLEALAAGLPIVATEVGGIPEVMGTPPAGILVRPGDVRELASALVKVASSGELRDRLSERAGRRSEAFSIEACVHRYEILYRNLITTTDATPNTGPSGYSSKSGKGGFIVS